MLVSEYDRFVQTTDQYKNRTPTERRDIALYGLVGEIGSLVAAVKKQILRSQSGQAILKLNDEVTDELGDIIWYCFSLAQIENKAPVNILTRNIAELRAEMAAGDDRAALLFASLDKARAAEFARLSERWPQTKDLRFSDYQNLAFLTARTDGHVLLDVCLSVLWQLGAELMRTKLPAIELKLNQAVVDRKTNTVLGEIAWHVAAIASLYGLTLDKVVERNVEKLKWLVPGSPTPLHDNGYPEAEQLPRRFDVSFVTAPGGKSQMYIDGQRFGDELSDNAYDGDGYRFHDVMHLANVAKLGWSPVLRSLMQRKRKSDPRIDEVEDGARARIVEELIIKAIHSEGERIARQMHPDVPDAELVLFASRADIPFSLLKAIAAFADGLEVSENRYWEWEEAIFEGYRFFAALKAEGQGTLSIDLEARSLSFSPQVHLDFAGTVVGAQVGSVADDQPGGGQVNRTRRVQIAVLALLNLENTDALRDQVEVYSASGNKDLRIHTSGPVRRAVWERGIVSFRVVEAEQDGLWTFSLIALSDPVWASRCLTTGAVS